MSRIQRKTQVEKHRQHVRALERDRMDGGDMFEPTQVVATLVAAPGVVFVVTQPGTVVAVLDDDSYALEDDPSPADLSSSSGVSVRTYCPACGGYNA